MTQKCGHGGLGTIGVFNVWTKIVLHICENEEIK